MNYQFVELIKKDAGRGGDGSVGKGIFTKPDDLSSAPGPHMVEGEK